MNTPVRVVLVAITKHGAQQTADLARQMPEASVCVADKFAPLMADLSNPVRAYSGPFRDEIAALFADFDQVVFFVSLGAVVRLIAPHLEEQERFQKGMVQGKKVCGSQIYRRDGRIFRSRNIPGNQDAAVGVLIDESASMDIHNRIGSARYTACVIYRFCQRLGIPVLILGHSTGIGEKKESVELYSYAEFDAWDQKDCFRLTGIRSRWNNRDGAALAYAGMRLGKRAEGQKLLFVISDGLPLAEGYRGEAGIADTRREREKLEHRGIHVMAAAIGEDRELIRRIYGKGFLNISDTERIPAAMAGIIRQYMGK